MKKRVLGILLVFCMLMSFSPHIKAAEIVASGNCGERQWDGNTYDYSDDVTWVLDSEGTLTISGTGKMGDSVFHNIDKYIVNVIIDDGVKNIGEWAFYYCNSLKKVTMADSVTEIGSASFDGCRNLSEIKLSSNITTIDNHAFDQCWALSEISLPNNITTIGDYAFSSCTFTEINLPNRLVSIGERAFAYGKLNHITIPSSVTYIGLEAFNDNDSLEINVQEANAAYSSIDGTLFNKDKTKLIAHTLNGSAESTRIYKIPDGVQIIGEGAFKNNSGWDKIILPESLITIESEAFNAANLDSDLFIPKNVSYIADGALANIGYMVGNIIVDENNKSYMSLDGVLFSKDMTELLNYPEGKEYYLEGFDEPRDVSYVIPEEVLYIKDYAFCDAVVNNVIMSDNVRYIGNHAFYGCDRLTEIHLSENLEEIGEWAFAYCTRLQDITIPNNIAVLNRNSFQDCKNLKNISLGYKLLKISDNVFERCESLSDIYYSGTEDEWNNIDVGKYGNNLSNTQIHLASKPVFLDTTKVEYNNGEYIFTVDRTVPHDCILVTVLYNNSVMTAAKTNTITSSEAQNIIHITAGEADTAKIFIWNSLNMSDGGFMPLCEAKTINIE